MKQRRKRERDMKGLRNYVEISHNKCMSVIEGLVNLQHFYVFFG